MMAQVAWTGMQAKPSSEEQLEGSRKACAGSSRISSQQPTPVGSPEPRSPPSELEASSGQASGFSVWRWPGPGRNGACQEPPTEQHPPGGERSPGLRTSRTRAHGAFLLCSDFMGQVQSSQPARHPAFVVAEVSSFAALTLCQGGGARALLG